MLPTLAVLHGVQAGLAMALLLASPVACWLLGSVATAAAVKVAQRSEQARHKQMAIAGAVMLGIFTFVVSGADAKWVIILLAAYAGVIYAARHAVYRRVPPGVTIENLLIGGGIVTIASGIGVFMAMGF